MASPPGYCCVISAKLNGIGVSTANGPEINGDTIWITWPQAAACDGRAGCPVYYIGGRPANDVGRAGKSGWFEPEGSGAIHLDFERLIVGGAQEIGGRCGSGVPIGFPKGGSEGRGIDIGSGD